VLEANFSGPRWIRYLAVDSGPGIDRPKMP